MASLPDVKYYDVSQFRTIQEAYDTSVNDTMATMFALPSIVVTNKMLSVFKDKDIIGIDVMKSIVAAL